jgi:hypothetical protein
MSIRYLTGCTNEDAEDYAASWSGELGLLIQPDNSYHLKIDRFEAWAADNGCFASKWDETKWWGWLRDVAAHAAKGADLTCEITGETFHEDLLATCLFAVAPDVVGDAEATLKKSRPWLSKIRDLGLPVAFVAQDGSEDLDANLIPWGEFDVLFLGGSTEFKLDPDRAGKVTREAVRRGIPVHMGRVNSAKRLKLAEAWGCETADGTFIGFGPERNVYLMAGWFDKLNPVGKKEDPADRREFLDWVDARRKGKKNKKEDDDGDLLSQRSGPTEGTRGGDQEDYSGVRLDDPSPAGRGRLVLDSRSSRGSSPEDLRDRRTRRAVGAVY